MRMRTPTLSGILFILFLMVLGHAVMAVGAAGEPCQLDGAQWIWFTTDPKLPLDEFPEGAVYFRSAITLPDKAVIQSAQVAITADNLFSLYLNGKPVGESELNSDSWSSAKRFDVTPLLSPGRNVLAVEAVNTAPGPGGLILKLVVHLAGGQDVVAVSDGTWKAYDTADVTWQQPGFNDNTWGQARVLGPWGMGPWGRVMAHAAAGPTAEPAEESADPQSANFRWPEAIAFIGDDCSLYRPRGGAGNSFDSLSVTIFNPNNSNAFPEHDLPAPMKVGHKLFVLKPARPGTEPKVLCDAGQGAIGSPSVSFDGQWIYVSLAQAGEGFFNLYRLPAAGGQPQRLTHGPFHDIDPAEMPDGRIVFTSTRIGTFEEYHSPPSRALFTMKADGSDIRPLTHTFVFDNQPKVLADGRIVFIRSDNFFDRGKVETLLHAMHPDGTTGYTEAGLELGPEYGGRLRAFNCGSPAPLSNGQVAFVTGSGIAVGWPGAKNWNNLPVAAGEVAPLPDDRLLCTLRRRAPAMHPGQKLKLGMAPTAYDKIGIIDPDRKGARAAVLYDGRGESLHSPVFLGARARPPVIASRVDPATDDQPQATGIFYCQNARLTRNTTAGWSHVRAVRILASTGLELRSSHSYIVHAGSVVTDLGTVPLAPDGSFAVEVPANTGIAFQAVDAEGRSELNEMSWIFVRPGETRGCVGCHHDRQNTPPTLRRGPIQALHMPPLSFLGTGPLLKFRGNNPAVTGLMELQFDRFREVAGVNRHSDTPDATGRYEVAALIAQLQSSDGQARVAAAQRLAIFRDYAAAPALATCLSDPQRRVRVAAAVALAACGTRQSVPPLLVATGDADPLVAQSAAMALENLIGHAEPEFDPYAAAPANPWPQWFKATTWEAIEQELDRRLESPDRDVVRRAAVALGHIGSAAATRAALRSYLVRERENNPLPEWRPSHQGDGARFNATEAVNPRTMQAVTRSIGYLQDTQAVGLLAETLERFSKPATGNLFWAEAAAEALGRIATPEAEAALVKAFGGLVDYPHCTSWYGDHGALMACHASPVHSNIIEALDAMGSTHAAGILPQLVYSVPTDFDRALLPGSDDYETLTGRVIRRNDPAATVVETCLAILGDPEAKATPTIKVALAHVHGCWGGTPTLEIRAAQLLSVACRDPRYAPRVQAAFARYLEKPTDIGRVFDHGIPVVQALPLKHWACFFLARTLGNLGASQTAAGLLATLEQSPAEGAGGAPDPTGPGVLFLHNDLTPCWRAEVAWALGRLGDRRAGGTLLKVIGDLANAPDTRHAAAEALERLNDPSQVAAVRKLATDYPDIATRSVLLRMGEHE